MKKLWTLRRIVGGPVSLAAVMTVSSIGLPDFSMAQEKSVVAQTEKVNRLIDEVVSADVELDPHRGLRGRREADPRPRIHHVRIAHSPDLQELEPGAGRGHHRVGEGQCTRAHQRVTPGYVDPPAGLSGRRIADRNVPTGLHERTRGACRA